MVYTWIVNSGNCWRQNGEDQHFRKAQLVQALEHKFGCTQLWNALNKFYVKKDFKVLQMILDSVLKIYFNPFSEKNNMVFCLQEARLDDLEAVYITYFRHLTSVPHLRHPSHSETSNICSLILCTAWMTTPAVVSVSTLLCLWM